MHSTSKMMRYCLLSMVFIFSIQTIRGEYETQFKIFGSPSALISMDNVKKVAPKANAQGGVTQNKLEKTFKCLPNKWSSTDVPQNIARKLIVNNPGNQLWLEHKSAVVISSNEPNTFCWIAGKGNCILTLIEDSPGPRFGIVYNNKDCLDQKQTIEKDGKTEKVASSHEVKCSSASDIINNGVPQDTGMDIDVNGETVTVSIKNKKIPTKWEGSCKLVKVVVLTGKKKHTEPDVQKCTNSYCVEQNKKKNQQTDCNSANDCSNCCDDYKPCDGGVPIEVHHDVPKNGDEENKEEGRRLEWVFLENIQHFNKEGKHGDVIPINCQDIQLEVQVNDGAGGEQRRLEDDDEDPATKPSNYRKFNDKTINYKCEDGEWKPVNDDNICQDATPNSAYGWGFLTAGTVWFVLFLIFHF